MRRHRRNSSLTLTRRLASCSWFHFPQRPHQQRQQQHQRRAHQQHQPQRQLSNEAPPSASAAELPGAGGGGGVDIRSLNTMQSLRTRRRHLEVHGRSAVVQDCQATAQGVVGVRLVSPMANGEVRYGRGWQCEGRKGILKTGASIDYAYVVGPILRWLANKVTSSANSYLPGVACGLGWHDFCPLGRLGWYPVLWVYLFGERFCNLLEIRGAVG